jgi:hypothetical protein
MLKLLVAMLLLVTPSLLRGGEIKTDQLGSDLTEIQATNLIEIENTAILKGGCGGDHDRDDSDSDEEDD